MKFTTAIRPLAVLAAAVLAISCGTDRAPTAPPPNPDLISGTIDGLTGTVTRTVGSLLSCRKLPEVRTSKVIGRDGGVLQVGPHTLVVPPGALDRNVTITAYAPSDTKNDIQFGPEGLQFDTPAALNMSYANCSLVVGLVPRIAYTTDLLAILYYVPSVNSPSSQTVTGRIDHFSRYAAAY